MPGCSLRCPARRRVTRRALSLAAGVLAFGQAALAGGLPAEESARIEALIAAVASLADASFIRNGQAHDSAVAAEFLRRKWRMKASNVSSAEDFIESVATFSSSTGRPYVIRYGDGREVPCSQFLRAELGRLRLRER